MSKTIFNLLNAYMNYGLEGQETKYQGLIQNYVAFCVTMAVAGILLVMSIVDTFVGERIPSLYFVAIAVVLLVAPMPLLTVRSRAAALAMLSGVLFLGCVAVSYITGPELGFFYVQGLVPILIGFLVRRSELIFLILFSVASSILGFVEAYHPFFAGVLNEPFDAHRFRAFVAFAGVSLFLLIGVRMVFLLWLKNSSVQLELLRRTLPEKIQHQVELGGDLPPAHDLHNVSILVIDIAGFSVFARTHTAETVLSLLTAFQDRVSDMAQEAGLHYIKSVGDSLLIADKVQARDLEQPTALFTLAKAVRHSIEARPILRNVQTRLTFGIASGKAAAGLIGEERMHFDMWGPAITLAFGLQGVARPGEIIAEDRFLKDLDPVLFSDGEPVSPNLSRFGVVPAMRLSAPH